MKPFLLIATCLGMMSCVSFPKPKVAPQPLSEKKEVLQVVGGSLHSDLIVPTQWVVKHGLNVPESLHSYRYLVFGWGDYVAYTERWGLADVPQALMWPSSSIVQVVGFNEPPSQVFPHDKIGSVEVDESYGKRLVAFLNNSFKKDENGQAKTVRKAKWGHGYFIDSPYSYYYPRMCNQWVSNALNAGGVSTAKPHFFQSSKGVLKQMAEFKKENETP